MQEKIAALFVSQMQFYKMVSATVMKDFSRMNKNSVYNAIKTVKRARTLIHVLAVQMDLNLENQYA